MQTVMTTNNAYDAILLVDADDVVVGAWSATPESVRIYTEQGADADKWEAQWEGFDGTCSAIRDYGDECGRNGVIANERRREFWFA